MTREEIIKGLENYIPWADEYEIDIEVLTGALELLKQEPCEDWYELPSDEMTLEQARQAVKDLREKLAEHFDETVSLGAFKQVIWERDIAIGQLKELGYDFGQKIEPSGDLISREAVKAYKYHRTMYPNFEDYVDMLPSVNPQEPKTEPKYCDRNICVSNEYNGIGCEDCEVTKSQEPKTGHCKECKYFEYDSVAKVDGVPLIVAHEICSRWGDGCKTKEDGYCFLFEPQESEE